METTGCYGVYRRTTDGRWLYPWGEEVLGAQDVTVADLLALGPPSPVSGGSDALRGLPRDPVADHDVEGGEIDWDDPGCADRVVGMQAPELHVRAMLTISDIAAMVGVEPDTIAAYRHRGYLPEPQAVIGRTPVWSRPVARHWLATRPGNGWRTDIYGDRTEHDLRMRHQRARRRRRRGSQPAP